MNEQVLLFLFLNYFITEINFVNDDIDIFNLNESLNKKNQG